MVLALGGEGDEGRESERKGTGSGTERNVTGRNGEERNGTERKGK